jgi:hypothetical protein
VGNAGVQDSNCTCKALVCQDGNECIEAGLGYLPVCTASLELGTLIALRGKHASSAISHREGPVLGHAVVHKLSVLIAARLEDERRIFLAADHSTRMCTSMKCDGHLHPGCHNAGLWWLEVASAGSAAGAMHPALFGPDDGAFGLN